jgi:hypothetical protein
VRSVRNLSSLSLCLEHCASSLSPSYCWLTILFVPIFRQNVIEKFTCLVRDSSQKCCYRFAPTQTMVNKTLPISHCGHVFVSIATICRLFLQFQKFLMFRTQVTSSLLYLYSLSFDIGRSINSSVHCSTWNILTLFYHCQFVVCLWWWTFFLPDHRRQTHTHIYTCIHTHTFIETHCARKRAAAGGEGKSKLSSCIVCIVSNVKHQYWNIKSITFRFLYSIHWLTDDGLPTHIYTLNTTIWVGI